MAVKIKEKALDKPDVLAGEPGGMSVWESGGFFQNGQARPDVYARESQYSGFDPNSSLMNRRGHVETHWSI